MNMNYTAHKMKVVFFDNADVFAIGFASDADPDTGEGSSKNSYDGDNYSDI